VPTNYPYGIDVYANPNSTNHLNDALVIHSAQHSNINDAMNAVQSWIGVSASFPMTGGLSHTIEFRIHNVLSGHNHDGINSRPSALGPPLLTGSVINGVYSYVSGLFPFSSSNLVGNAVDQINRYLLTVSTSIAGISGVVVVTASINPRQLILLSEDPGGPYEGFEPGAYRESGYVNNVFLSQSTWWEDSTKTKKIIETFIRYNQNKTINNITQSVYAIDGISIIKTSVDTIYYSGIKETYRSRSLF